LEVCQLTIIFTFQNHSNMDNLTQQIVNISKAGAYDIIVKHRDELAEENARLKERVKFLESLIKEYTEKMLTTLKS
jgi:hypothetical protein